MFLKAQTFPWSLAGLGVFLNMHDVMLCDCGGSGFLCSQNVGLTGCAASEGTDGQTVPPPADQSSSTESQVTSTFMQPGLLASLRIQQPVCVSVGGWCSVSGDVVRGRPAVSSEGGVSGRAALQSPFQWLRERAGSGTGCAQES